MRAERLESYDAEVLWALSHQAGSARCLLVFQPTAWRLVLQIEENSLQTQCCCRAEDALAMAESWKSRLMALGWQEDREAHRSRGGQVTPFVRSTRG